MTIHTHKNFKKVILVGTLIACIGGYVNSLCIIEFNHTVSHMTGNLSKMGIDIVYGQFKPLLFLIGLLFSFMMGAGTAAVIVGNAKFKLGRRYGAALSLEGILLLCAVVLERFPVLDIPAQYILAFACGVQNAMCTNYSGAVVRTTHVTGIVTDIAMVTGFWLKYHKSHPQSIEIWKLKILVPLALGFVSGASLGAGGYMLMGRIALLIPASLLVLVSTIYIIKTHKDALVLKELEKLRAQRYKEAQEHLNASGGILRKSRSLSRQHSRIGSVAGSRVTSRVPSPVISPALSRINSLDNLPPMPPSLAHLSSSHFNISRISPLPPVHEGHHEHNHNDTSPDQLHSRTSSPGLNHSVGVVEVEHHLPGPLPEGIDEDHIFDTSDEEDETDSEEEDREMEQYVIQTHTGGTEGGRAGGGGGAILI